MRPLARSEKLLMREIDGEIVVYDLESHEAHCLNATAAATWKHADGGRDLPELASRVSEDLGESVDEELVQVALVELASQELVEFPLYFHAFFFEPA